MKRYKLIKKYPLCGYELNQIISTDFIWDNHCKKAFLKDYSEFWKEIVEKDYEILSFKIPGNDHWRSKLEPNGMYGGWSESHAFNELKKGNWSIWSVKRLSDGEIFTVGDFTEEGIILGFDFPGKNIETFTNARYRIDNFGHGMRQLSVGKKVKKPLFTTEDGVDIFEGEQKEIFYIKKGEFIIIPVLSCNYWCNERCYIRDVKIENWSNLYFSTKEAAEKYIIFNKPQLSINDILALEKQTVTKFKSILIELVKLRL